MNSIYTTLNKKEVQMELLRVVNVTSAACTLRNAFKLLGKSSEEVLQQPAHLIMPFLSMAMSHLGTLDREFLTQSKLAASAHLLIRHPDTVVQSQAAHIYTTARSFWMSTSESKPPKVLDQ